MKIAKISVWGGILVTLWLPLPVTANVPKGMVYLDIEADAVPSTVLNQHYRLSIEGDVAVTSYSQLFYKFDTALFDWDTPWTMDRLRAIPEFSYQLNADSIIPKSQVSVVYGPGELVTFHRQVFAKRASGISLTAPVGDVTVTASLRLKPTFTDDSNIKVFGLELGLKPFPDLWTRIGWEFSSANTADIFRRSGGYDERISGQTGLAIGNGCTLNVYAVAGTYGTVSRMDLAIVIPNSEIRVDGGYVRVSSRFFKSELKPYYSDYSAVDPLNELIENGTSVVYSQVRAESEEGSWLMGVYARLQDDHPSITTLRLRRQVVLGHRQYLGGDIRYHMPHSFGQGYRWEGKLYHEIEF